MDDVGGWMDGWILIFLFASGALGEDADDSFVYYYFMPLSLLYVSSSSYVNVGLQRRDDDRWCCWRKQERRRNETRGIRMDQNSRH
jgi:hypothetical protein